MILLFGSKGWIGSKVVKMLEDKSYTLTSLAKMAADTPYNTTSVNLTGLANTGLPYLEFQG
jgi:nucleoside-diphosphate-sugar epimerase